MAQHAWEALGARTPRRWSCISASVSRGFAVSNKSTVRELANRLEHARHTTHRPNRFFPQAACRHRSRSTPTIRYGVTVSANRAKCPAIPSSLPSNQCQKGADSRILFFMLVLGISPICNGGWRARATRSGAKPWLYSILPSIAETSLHDLGKEGNEAAKRPYAS